MEPARADDAGGGAASAGETRARAPIRAARRRPLSLLFNQPPLTGTEGPLTRAPVYRRFRIRPADEMEEVRGGSRTGHGAACSRARSRVGRELALPAARAETGRAASNA